jgi:FkbM family methyltransferase
MEPLKRRALFSTAFQDAIAGDPITLVDAGARGGLEEPWQSLPSGTLEVVGFEPDTEECERLNANAPPGRRFLPVALWDRDGEVELHVADVPSCSSVHPPNAELLAAYRPEHARPRATRSVVRYPATTLDKALAKHPVSCDVLKVDTQGSEGEILSGGIETIRSDVLCAIVETWTVPVHRGQALTGDVLQLMDRAGMTLFDAQVAAAWRRPLPDGVEADGKRQVTGMDLLFLRDPLPSEPESRVLKLAVVADVFGFPDFALDLLAGRSSTSAGTVRDAVIAGNRAVSPPRTLLDRLRRRRPSAPPDFAPLHS